MTKPKNPNHGGSRPGAGRPRSEHPTTKSIRVPYEFANRAAIDELIALRALVQDFQALAEDESPTSPRYEKLREFLAIAKEQSPNIL